MDRLNFAPAGGTYLNPEDLEFQDRSNRKAIEALVRPIAGLVGGSMILWGCERFPQGSNVVISEGYVVIGYELRYFPATSIPANTDAYIVADDFLDPSGDELLANGQPFNGYERRAAKIDFLAGLQIKDGYRYFNLIQDGLNDSSNDFQNALTTLNGWTNSSVEPMTVARKIGKATLFGSAIVGALSATQYTTIAILPVGLRPLRRQTVVVAVLNSGAVTLNIFPAGIIEVINLVGDLATNQGALLYLPEITWDLT